MAWKTKLVAADDIILHAYNRGVDRCPIFYRKSDYDYILEEMARRASMPGIVLLCYILMPNHYHIVAKQLQPYAISKYIQEVMSNYVRYLNRTRPRTGHLFESPFKPKRVADEASLLRLSYYVHNNAVHAKLVPSAEKWPYSSILQYTEGVSSRLVVTEPLLELVGGIEGHKEFMRTYDSSQPASVSDFIIHRV